MALVVVQVVERWNSDQNDLDSIPANNGPVFFLLKWLKILPLGSVEKYNSY